MSKGNIYYSKCTYTGPTMTVRCVEPYSYVVLMDGDKVMAEMSLNKTAKIISVRKLDKDIKVQPVYVVSDYIKADIEIVSKKDAHDIYWYRKEIERICSEHRWNLSVRSTLIGIEIEVKEETASHEYHQIAFEATREASEDNAIVFKRAYDRLVQLTAKPERISFQEDRRLSYMKRLSKLCDLNNLTMTIEDVNGQAKVTILDNKKHDVMNVTDPKPDKVYKIAFDHLNLMLKENGGKYYNGDVIFPLDEKKADSDTPYFTPKKVREFLEGIQSRSIPRNEAESIINGDKDGHEVGGTHYGKMAIEPWDYIYANKLDFDSGNVVKYISRHKDKNGAEDVKKAISFCEHILKTQYGVERNK